ncbi:MAG: DUF5714 domain-containing protein [Bacillota bacterium]
MSKINTGCLLCQEELCYNPSAPIDVICMCCGKQKKSYVTCANGHYVCDECHRKKILLVVEELCMVSDLTDPVELALQIFRLPGLNMHGPEYHSIVAAVLVTAYTNITKDKNAQVIKEAINRGKDVKGGVCGSHGCCGAAVGVGIAYAIINNVIPYSKVERGLANKMTALALLQISLYGGPRCCKRDAMIAIEVARREFPYFENKSNSRYICNQYPDNKECINEKCPYHPL